MVDDNTIIDLFFERDETAIKVTQEKYGKRLLALSESILYARDEAAECENDTYLRAWQTIPPKEPRTWLFNYLASIIRNLSIDRYRKRKKEESKAEFVTLTDEMAECLPGSESPESVMISEYDRMVLREALNEFVGKLAKEHRVLFIKRYFYFEEPEMIAEEMKRSRSWVKTNLFRIRQKLKKSLLEKKLM